MNTYFTEIKFIDPLKGNAAILDRRSLDFLDEHSDWSGMGITQAVNRVVEGLTPWLIFVLDHDYPLAEHFNSFRCSQSYLPLSSWRRLSTGTHQTEDGRFRVGFGAFLQRSDLRMMAHRSPILETIWASARHLDPNRHWLVFCRDLDPAWYDHGVLRPELEPFKHLRDPYLPKEPGPECVSRPEHQAAYEILCGLDAGEDPDAVLHYGRHLLAAGEDNVRIRKRLGWACMMTADFKAAEIHALAGRAFAPDSVQMNGLLSEVYARQEKLELVVDPARWVLEADPYRPEALFHLSMAGVALQDNCLLKDYAARWLETEPVTETDLWLASKLSVTVAEEGLYEEAVRIYHVLFDLVPLTSTQVNNMAFCLAHLGRLDEAEQYIEQALRLKADDVNALDTRGEIYLMQGDYEKAALFFKRALDVDPLHRPAIENFERTAALLEQLHL